MNFIKFSLSHSLCIVRESVKNRSFCIMTNPLVSTNMFIGKPDRFKGITVLSNEEPCSTDELRDKLRISLQHWNETGVRGVWFYVNIEDTEWIPVLVENGFIFHHAKPDRVGMIKWLPKNESYRMPSYAHHMVGVGGMVVNDNDEVLVIKEKYSLASQWKFPGGYVDPGEDLSEAAEREVKEETGIDTTFQSLVSLRHAHGYNFDCSDFYIIVYLKVKNPSQEIKICERELTECKWMPLSEFKDSENVNNINKYFMEKFIDNRKNGIEISKKDMLLKIKNLVKEQQIYSIGTIDKCSDK